MQYKYPTATSEHIAKQNKANDLRYGAPNSDVRVFKIINGKEVFIGTQPDMNYFDARDISNQHYGRKNNIKGERK
jgi:hypothetical protein